MVNSSIDYGAVRADLIARRNDLDLRRSELDAAISAVEKIMVSVISSVSSSKGTDVESTPKDQMFRGLTIAKAAALYLQSSDQKQQTAKEIADALQRGGYVFSSKDPGNTVNAVLYRASARGLLKRVGAAIYSPLTE